MAPVTFSLCDSQTQIAMTRLGKLRREGLNLGNGWKNVLTPGVFFYCLI